ncbi:polysaccharide deacetylase [Clostridium sp. SHJSY1]|uniref:polysaccharide deacetylase family protein n=1 Tax=Clostridium sp. SHJSY1 TaxID=2942483 RepID=UPI00287491EF|nr:polysaccharide deacetylase family protein [Clostridium sp. SHJSY1]MDS0524169.1 polysaccharide deacetylase [Clostridium sp. SHJSY1]
MLKKFIKLTTAISTIILTFNLTTINVFSDESNSKTIYLTFDDGPAKKITEETLDILKKEDVPATFFIIGDQIKGQEKLLMRMKDEGHSVGLHSMSHDRCKLYSGNNNFLKEMLEERDSIKEVIGIDCNILRFPFGCNNRTFHLTPDLVDIIHKNNLKIYDWNVDTTDGANVGASPYKYVKNAKSNKETVFLLMHCGYINKTSPKALPEIIKYYKDKGYKFKAITDETDEIFHYISK